MKNRFLSAALGLSLTAYFVTARDVVINEIMYHPFHLASQAEDTGQEWIELRNRQTNAVNLQGWRLTKGVAFTFTNVTLPPGGYIVVAASRTNFLAKYAG
ncbi:MAG TPA: lamin tail domain-containing protein, partial [Verrucomicrobiae bacterium]